MVMKKGQNQRMDQSLSIVERISGLDSVYLVLGGGGIKGIAHIALIDHLHKKGIEIKGISGSSAGALVGGLYASGRSIQEMIDFFVKTPLFRYTWLNPFKAGLFDSYKYLEVLKDQIVETFEDLNIPLHVATVNLQLGKPCYFNKGSLLPALLASCAVPAIFSPVLIEGSLYTDGGVMDNFPIEPIQDIKTPIIGSYVSTPPVCELHDLDSIFKVSQHANLLLLHSANSYKFDKTYTTLNFPLEIYGTFDSKKALEIYSRAEQFLQERI